MTRTRARLSVIAAGAILLLSGAACSSDNGGGAGATPTPTSAAQCPVGKWRSTEVSSSGSGLGVTVTAHGGSDAKVTIGDDGAVRAIFSGMRPIEFTAQVAGAQVKGEIVYGGNLDGKVDLTATNSGSTGGMTASPSGAATTAASPSGSGASAAWQPVGDVDWSSLRLTVRLSEPVSATILNNVKISEVTGAQTTQAGGAVDLQPLLRDGEYRCDGNDTLVITPHGNGPTVTWTFKRQV
ncbi:MAG: hypothetical protein ACM30G_14150 [Micromonosporaceae bacterium]